MPDLYITPDPASGTGTAYPPKVLCADDVLTRVASGKGTCVYGNIPEAPVIPLPASGLGCAITGVVRMVPGFPTILDMSRSAAHCDIGDRVRIHAVFTINGQRVDPTTVKFRVKPPEPDALETRTYAQGQPGIIKSETGKFYADFDPIVSGLHWVRFEGTGGAMAAGELSIMVRLARALE